MERFVISLIIFLIGLGLLNYTRAIEKFFGHMDFAEDVFGAGGTHKWVKLIGVAAVFGSLLYLFGVIDF